MLFVSEFYKLLRILQTLLQIPKNRLSLEQFSAIQCFNYLIVEAKTSEKIKKKQYCVFCDKTDEESANNS